MSYYSKNTHHIVFGCPERIERQGNLTKSPLQAKYILASY